MKSLLVVLTAGILFAAGAMGMYFLMPVVAPEKVLQARHYLDSLDAVLAGDSTFLAHLEPAKQVVPPPPPDTTAGDTIRVATPVADAAAEVASPPAEKHAAPVEGEPPAEALAGTDQAARARELSGVISKLEDPELRALVSNLDSEVLSVLYREASARNKTRLLQAIPPERAAEFVRGLIVPVSSR